MPLMDFLVRCEGHKALGSAGLSVAFVDEVEGGRKSRVD